LFGILPPEVIPLRGRILRVRESNAENILHEAPVSEGSRTQLSPIFPLASIDNIVDCGQDISDPVIQVPMQHALSFLIVLGLPV